MFSYTVRVLINGEPRLFLQLGSFKKQKLFQMSKYKNYNHVKKDGPGYDGCIASGLKLTMIGAIIIAICFVLFSCHTSEPCGTYSKWEAKTKFRSK